MVDLRATQCWFVFFMPLDRVDLPLCMGINVLRKSNLNSAYYVETLSSGQVQAALDHKEA